MIKRTTKLIAALLIGAVVFSGCTLAKMLKMAAEQQLTVTPNPIELHGDSVNFELSALLPVKMLKKNYVYNVETSYKYADQIEKLGSVEFRFEDFPSTTDQPLIKKSFSFPYTSQKENGKVVVICSAAKVTGKAKSAPEFQIAEGVITTSLLVKNENYVAYANHGYNNQEELEATNVAFLFDKAKSNLKTTEIKGGEGKKMTAFIASKILTRTVNLVGMHSPEGSEKINTELAANRPKAIEKHYRTMMKKYDYKSMADSINFKVIPVVQNWDEFKKVLATTTKLTEEEKATITATISSGGSFVDQEKSLKTLPSYKKLVKFVYPTLRTAKTEILSVIDKKTDAEMAALAGLISKADTTAEALSAEELGYAATLTPVLEEQEAIYKALVKKTENAVAYNNLGAVYLEMAKKEADASKSAELVKLAKTNLEIAVKKEAIAEAHNNLAVVYTMTGDKLKALENYDAASKKGGNADFNKGLKANLGSCQIRHAKYADAIRNLTNSNLSNTAKYNLALAQLLTNDYATAQKNFANVNNDALASYCAAIACARLADNTGMAKNLKDAIVLDSSLREKAMKDLEFKKLVSGTAFLDAIK